MHLILIILFLFLSLCLMIKACSGPDSSKDDANITPPYSDQTDTLDPSLQGPTVVASASIGITGSIFPHQRAILSAKTEDGNYDFSNYLNFISNSYQSFDFMVACLEATLGEPGDSTPSNCPDSLIDALKDAGVDMLLTSSDQVYAAGHFGFTRTQEVLTSKGMLYTGTRPNTDVPNYTLLDINGIKIGMLNYTYETGDTALGNKTINDIAVDKEDTDLINSYNYRKMGKFYDEVKAAKEAMDAQGADCIIVFIHWGNEYDRTPSNTQKTIAENLCNLGVDFIVGSHPHIVQPMEVLTSEAGTKTYCLYSAGSAISGERRGDVRQAANGHTEDGIIFDLKLHLMSDGSVTIADINATPLWTSVETVGGKDVFTILPVDVTYNFFPALSNFVDTVNGVIDPDREPTDVQTLTLSDSTKISESYTRTMDTILTGLNECRQALGLTPVSNIPAN